MLNILPPSLTRYPSRHRIPLLTLLIGGMLCLTVPCRGQQPPPLLRVQVPVSPTLDSLLHEEDTDGDKNITVDDPRIAGTSRGDRRHVFTALNGKSYEVAGTYYLSNLLQELTLARDRARDTAVIEGAHVFEPSADRISRSIRTRYWDGLTRTIDEQGLSRVITDEKTQTIDGRHYLYVPPDDATAIAYYQGIAARHPDWKLAVVALPSAITPSYVRQLAGRHGLLSLALRKTGPNTVEGVPFVVPGGRFNEMYGWDTYFILLGLLHDGRIALARDLVENFLYELKHYGAILNANRTYYLTRSQPPFFTSMLMALRPHLPHNQETLQWMHEALDAAIGEYSHVWMDHQRLTATGLSRYFDAGTGPPPEVEPGAFDSVYAPKARQRGIATKAFEEQYRAGTITDSTLDEYFVNDRSMRESGHDTSYRLLGRSADLTTVDLNSLLYKMEMDIATLIQSEFKGRFRSRWGSTETSARWFERARERRRLINMYLWDPTAGLYFDYDVRTGRRTGYLGATVFYPLWAGAADTMQAAMVIARALPLLEMAGGIAGSSEQARGPVSSSHPQRQWDYPFGWAPHQIIVWQALQRYHRLTDARRLAYRWLYTIAVNAAHYNGTVPEKFDVVRRSHEVFAEYGNVGTAFSYITREGFGWTNTSFQLGMSLLTPMLRDRLNALVPPEWILSTQQTLHPAVRQSSSAPRSQ